jgi:hypothetical protein
VNDTGEKTTLLACNRERSIGSSALSTVCVVSKSLRARCETSLAALDSLSNIALIFLFIECANAMRSVQKYVDYLHFYVNPLSAFRPFRSSTPMGCLT